MCTIGKDVISTSGWFVLTWSSSLKMNNCNTLSPSWVVLKRLPSHFSQDQELVERISAVRVQSRTSKGIAHLLLPQTSLSIDSAMDYRHQGRLDMKANTSMSRAKSDRSWGFGLGVNACSSCHLFRYHTLLHFARYALHELFTSCSQATTYLRRAVTPANSDNFTSQGP